MLGVLKNLIQDENGQAMVEYGLVLGVLATGAILLILAVRNSTIDLVFERTTGLSKDLADLLKK